MNLRCPPSPPPPRQPSPVTPLFFPVVSSSPSSPRRRSALPHRIFFYDQVDLLPEIALPPRILSNYVAALSHNNIKQDLDKFLQTRHQPVNFLAELPGRLRLSAHEVHNYFGVGGGEYVKPVL